jgi:hypothetical protein
MEITSILFHCQNNVTIERFTVTVVLFQQLCREIFKTVINLIISITISIKYVLNGLIGLRSLSLEYNDSILL